MDSETWGMKTEDSTAVLFSACSTIRSNYPEHTEMHEAGCESNHTGTDLRHVIARVDVTHARPKVRIQNCSHAQGLLRLVIYQPSGVSSFASFACFDRLKLFSKALRFHTMWYGEARDLGRLVFFGLQGLIAYKNIWMFASDPKWLFH